MTTRQMLTVPEAAEILRVSANHVYKLAERGEIEHLRLGRRVLIPRVVIDDLCGLTVATAPALPSVPATDRSAGAVGAAGPGPRAPEVLGEVTSTAARAVRTASARRSNTGVRA